MNTTTEEKNRVIAAFMELEDAPDYIKHDFGRDDVYFIEGEYSYSNAKYDTSYDWIMPVVNKCLAICHAEMLNEWEESFTDAFLSMSIDRLHDEAFKFALWYKENSQS